MSGTTAKRAGIRVKARVPSELWQRVRACVEACHVSAEDYVCSVCRGFSTGTLCVPIGENLPKGTRGESETVWVRVPADFDRSAENLRRALLAGVAYTESKIPAPRPRLVEGVHYLVEGKTYTRFAGGVVS